MHFKLISILLLISAAISTYIFTNDKSAEVTETLIPRKVLFGNPDKMSVMLSPDGKYISYIAPYNGVLNIWIALKDDIASARVITNDDTRGIRNYTWAYDNKNILYLLDNKGDENYRVYSQNIHNHEKKLLTPENGVRASIAYTSYKFPNLIMISTNERNKEYFDIYKYDLLTGSKELFFENNSYDNVILDEDLQIRFASLINKNGDTEYFKFENGQWLPFIEVSLEDSDNTGIYGFDKTGNILYLSDSRNRNTAALKAVNLITGESTIIAEDDRSDVSIFTAHPTENTIQATATTYEKTKYKILDNSIKADIAYLETLGDGELIINNRSLDDQHWVVAIRADDVPVKYYLYDRLKKTAKFLFSNQAELERYKLAKMYPLIIKSRDGLDLVSYITYPYGTILNDKMQPKQPLPLVLLVHGGPWVRDYWGLDSKAQWLSNRGYAVLSVNYRGSTGFGKNFTNAGNLQWGKKMHDDLIDAVNWAIANKIAPSDKIAIMGGSYGGYTTLAGLTLTPDVFACGVDIVGPSNLVTLLQNFPAYWAPAMNVIKRRVGSYDTDEEKQALLEVSPLTFADKIKKPLLIGQGAYDPRVTQLESDQIVAAMKSKNIPVIYALYKDEGHGFARPENRISFYALTELFLAKILGGKSENIGEDLKGANLVLNGQEPKDSIDAEQSIDKAIGK